MSHAQPFQLWVLCIDEQVEKHLQQLALPHVKLIPLREVETAALLAVKPTRTRGEYCWTLTPFTFQAVFDRDPSVDQITYLDADLFFFSSPQILLRELDADKHVLFTEHAYAPEYDQTETSGRFCVQFLTFRRTEEAARVMRWWQDRCVEWCFSRCEGGKFGDQRYLDYWPKLFGNDVQIVRQVEKTLAPWNVYYFDQKQKGNLTPVFYHFHGVKIVNSDQIQLYLKYRISQQGMRLYEAYIAAIHMSVQRLQAIEVPVPYFPLSRNFLEILRRWKWIVMGETKIRSIQKLNSCRLNRFL
jgi:hypothetical protein